MRKKHIRHFVILTMLTTAVLAMSACGKKNLNKEGEDTNYPFTWEEKKNGTILVNLDGSYSPDYTWSVLNSDDTIASVEAKKDEKNGKITYKITPKAEGYTTVEFIREKEAPAITVPAAEEFVEGGVGSDAEKDKEIKEIQEKEKQQPSETASEETTEEGSEDASEEGSEEVVSEEPAEEDEYDFTPEVIPGGVYISGTDDAGNPLEEEQQIIGDESPEAELEEVVEETVVDDTINDPIDRVCHIVMTIEVTPTGNSSKKFKAAGNVMGIEERDSLRAGEKNGLSYVLWTDDSGSLRLLVNGIKSTLDADDWIITESCVYTGSDETLTDENGNPVDDPYGSETEKNADGQYDILDVTHSGYYKESSIPIYVINATGDGTGEVTFEFPGNNVKISISLELSSNRIKVTNCNLN